MQNEQSKPERIRAEPHESRENQGTRVAKNYVGEYKVLRLPKHRELLGDLERMTTKHPIQALMEFDVTEARTLMREYEQKSGETISFTAWIIKCIAEAVSENKQVQAYRKGKRLVIFEDVDIGFAMDMTSQSGSLVAGSIVRKANEKSLRTIHEEIRSAQRREPVYGTIVGEGDEARLAGRFQSMPGVMRRLAAWWYKGNPWLRKRTQGTVGITSVGNILGSSSGMWDARSSPVCIH